MSTKIPSASFKNGFSIPLLGLGTWQSDPGQVTDAVKEAIVCGYRHIDCAKAYENEAEVGEAIRAKIQDGTVKRNDLFITSKLWITYARKDLVMPVLKEQLKNLGVSYLDLYILHWPVSFKEGDVLFPQDADGKIIFSHNDYVNTWRGMEQCVREGLVKSIGVSNFNKRQLERLLKTAEFPPVNNQVECHPYLNQKRLINFCKSKGVVVTAYSPLGSPTRPLVHSEHPVLLQDPLVNELAEKYDKTAAQILIRYHIQNGTVVIPKSVTPSRIQSNFQVFNFQMTATDLDSLESLNEDLRYIAFPAGKDHPEYPFKEEY